MDVDEVAAAFRLGQARGPMVIAARFAALHACWAARRHYLQWAGAESSDMAGRNDRVAGNQWAIHAETKGSSIRYLL